MKRYLDFQCKSCSHQVDDCFTPENILPCPVCGGEMVIVWKRAPRFGDPVALGITKPPSDFQKYVLGKIKSKYKNSTLEKTHAIPKEV